MTTHPVQVKVQYWIGKESKPIKSETWTEDSVEPARIGLPPDTAPQKPQAGDYTYTGMHDQGPLPEPRQGGSMAKLIACVQQAKATNDEFLTSVIENEKEEQHHHHQEKKLKVGDDG